MKVENILRGISDKISNKELQDIVDAFNSAERYVSELEITNSQLIFNLRKSEEKLNKTVRDYETFVFYAKNGMLDFHKSYNDEVIKIDKDIEAINNQITEIYDRRKGIE